MSFIAFRVSAFDSDYRKGREGTVVVVGGLGGWGGTWELCEDGGEKVH